MGVSHKSRGKKSDKETQSPMFKIFKDMMQKEKTDPEKVNLLKDAKTKREKRKKSYPGSRSEKTDHKSYDSSSTDYKNKKHTKITVQNLQEERKENSSRDRSKSSAFRDERRESWWLWKDKDHDQSTPKKKSDDTFSCASCALKKIIGSEYTCVACLLILFSISVVAAFLVVCKTMPSTEEVTEKNMYGDTLVKKIGMLKKRQLTEGYGFTEKSKWDDSLMNPIGSYPNLFGSEYSGNNNKGANIMADLETGMSEDLASILDNDKMMEGQNNQRMRDFFQKLIETDAQIRKLKQSISNNYQIDNLKTITDRYKRSIKKIKIKNYARSKDNNKVTTKKITSKGGKGSSKKDNKRSVTPNGLGLTGYVIESKEVVIKYDTDKRRNFPKCSHAYEDVKSHEEQLKHPFYKHSQRVDEMLSTNQKPDEKNEYFNAIFGDSVIDDIWNTTNSDIDTKTEDDKLIIESITKANKIEPYDYKSRLKYREDINHHGSNGEAKIDHERFFVRTTDEHESSSKYDDKIFKENSVTNDDKINDLENGLFNDYIRSLEEKEQYRRFGFKKVGDKKADDTNHNQHHHTTTSSTTVKESDTSSDFDYKTEMFATSAPLYDVAISVSTLINSMDKANLKQKLPRKPYIGQRSLLQVDEENADQEELGYEDLKEVLADDKEGHDDMDRHERNKRDNDEKVGVPEDLNPNKHNPMNVFNQNWKGPLPLYPEELNAMIRNAALQNMQIPDNSKDTKQERDRDTISKRISTCPTATKAFEGFKFELKKGIPSNTADFRKNVEKCIKIIGHPHSCHTHGPISTINYEFDKLLTPKLLLDSNAHASNTVSDSNTTPNQYVVVTFKKGSRSLKSFDLTYEDSNTVDEAIKLNLDKVDNTINQEPNTNVNNGEKDFIRKNNVLNVYDLFNETTTRKVNEDYYYMNNENNKFVLTTNKHLDMIKNVDYTQKARNSIYRKAVRTLKSIEPIGENDSKLSVYNNNIINVINSIKTDSIVNKTNNNNNGTTNGVISFISIMSDWLQTLANLSGEMKNEDFRASSSYEDSSSNTTTPKLKRKYLEENITKGILNPAYDVEIVDNIGHRSRVLMSFDDNSTAKSGMEKLGLKINSDLQKNRTVINDILPVALVLATNDTKTEPKSDNTEEQTNKTNNKTVVKRSLGEHLVFWNDLYDDDEYGIKLDYNDNIRDKHSAKKFRNILNKSRDWLQDKFSNVTNEFKGKWRKRYGKIKIDKKITTKLLLNEPVVIKKERRVRESNDNENVNTKKTFAALTANMKNVVREAAKAIQDTRNIEVRENNKEDAAASSLMQHLVRMMSDLVDIQVQQKTCAKLPSDLHNFLEWLTAPAEDSIAIDDWATTPYDYDEAMRFAKATEQNVEDPITFTEDTHQDDRTECLGTIRAVQDLIQEYDGMSDEDKSKMTGVREYLENQLLFLNNKLNNLNEPDLYKLYEKRDLWRRRRDIEGTSREEKQKQKEDIKNTTNSIDKNTTSSVASTVNSKEEKSSKKKVKRNWRDVYFKAVEDSKKTSTIKDSNKPL